MNGLTACYLPLLLALSYSISFCTYNVPCVCVWVRACVRACVWCVCGVYVCVIHVCLCLHPCGISCHVSKHIQNATHRQQFLKCLHCIAGKRGDRDTHQNDQEGAQQGRSMPSSPLGTVKARDLWVWPFEVSNSIMYKGKVPDLFLLLGS